MTIITMKFFLKMWNYICVHTVCCKLCGGAVREGANDGYFPCPGEIGTNVNII